MRTNKIIKFDVALSSGPIFRVLFVGSRGEEVRILQQYLGLKADGIFGSDTQNAVKNWQTKNNLTNDGIVDKKTWESILAAKAKDGEVKSLSTELVIQDLKISQDNLYAPMLSKLQFHIPEQLLSQINLCIVQFGMFEINAPLRMAHFLGQCHYESAGFKIMKENLNYSAEGLKRVFGKYFFDIDPELYARQPEKIASRVYANRMGNGDEESKDGFKYAGRGYIQLTGRDNYREFSMFIKDEAVMHDPELVCTKYPLASAGWYWTRNRINMIADRGIDDATIIAITRIVNGSLNGLEDRKEHCNHYYQLLR